MKPVSFFILLLSALLLFLCCFSCNPSHKPGYGNGQANVVKDTLLRAEPYYTFAKQLEASINNGLPDFFNDHFDVSLVTARLFRDIKAPRKFEQTFSGSIKESIDAGAQVIASLEGTGVYHLAGITGLPYKPSAIFRVTNNGTLNYHQVFFSSATALDLVRIEDFCIFKGGLSFSETLKMVLLSALSQQPDANTTVQTLNSTDLALLQHRQTIDKISIAIHEKAFGKAMRLLKSLPPEAQQHKMVLLQQLSIGYYLKNELLTSALSVFEQTYPQNPVPRFALLDLALEAKDNDRIITYADDLAQVLPDATYLQIVKATAYENMGKAEAAEKLLTGVLKQEPENREAYRILAALYLDEQNYEKAVSLFELMEQNIDSDPAELLSGMDYDEFWQSEFYKNWATPQQETTNAGINP
ncbi:hypothetical protein C7N43_18650 [Sphingobacteriales bacterium UPWRP_1]|nr:hypothetical protein B6N25_06495 [Sphingobacteriales bacterium TSM_CSS]PSJ75472.1 hypothetical protein C7N43_18650 [Sphingobacteriales bacterium UPWRP_1]